MAAGGVVFAPADAPAVGGAHGSGRGQAATGRGAEVGFDAQGVDQRTVTHRVFGDLHAQASATFCVSCRRVCCRYCITRINAVDGSPLAIALMALRA